MTEELAVNLATKAAESLVSQIWQDLQCLLNYNNNIKKLEEKVKDLECEQSRIKVRVDEAERDGQVIMDNVSNWIKKVDDMRKHVKEGLAHTRNTQHGCLYCKCPKLHSRYKLSKKALEWTTEVTELLDSSNFDTIGYHAPPGQMPFTSIQLFEYESRTRTSNDVMEALRGDSINTIGICGMAGVGKTTLVKEIADKVKAAKLFDEVVMAVVSKDFIIRNIQDQLAENLGLTIQETTDHRRAERLYERLKKKDRKILVILDDLWDKLDFREIGIPIEGECDGLKVLLTSRFRGVCTNMKAKPFEVNVLSKEESWYLFKKIAEISEEMDGIRKIAKEVADECGGLPLAIVIVGGALKGKKEDSIWREVLRQLKEGSVTSIPDVRKKVNSAIDLSYNYLEKEPKLLLLLCSLFPEDYDIPLENLIRYANGLQFFVNVKTIARVRDKVELIMDELRGCYLLLAGYKEKHVKLHDVVRDVCISMATSGEHIHTVRHDALIEWPQDIRYSSTTAMSLSFEKVNQLRCDLEYGELKLLSLYGDISVIGSQTKLEILSFYDSWFEYYPNKIYGLSNLKCLDIRGPPLPSGILLRLKNLEELYLGSYKGEEANSVYITELSSVMNLQTFQFCANGNNHCLEQVLDNLHYEKLKRFEISSVPKYIWITGDYQLGSELYFKNVNVDLLQKHVTQYLLSITKVLSLIMVPNIKWILDVQMPTSYLSRMLHSLQTLLLEDCKSVEVVFDFTGLYINGEESGESLLARLESMTLCQLPNLKHLWRKLPIEIYAFKNLKELRVYECDSLRFLLSPSMAKMLVGLETLYLLSCKKMEAIIGVDKTIFTEPEIVEDGVKKEKEKYIEESTKKIVFQKLTYLCITGCDDFRMLCSINVDLELPSLSNLYIAQCPKMNKFCVGQLSATSLDNVWVVSSDTHSSHRHPETVTKFNLWLKDCESGIRCLACSCNNIERCDHLS